MLIIFLYDTRYTVETRYDTGRVSGDYELHQPLLLLYSSTEQSNNLASRGVRTPLIRLIFSQVKELIGTGTLLLLESFGGCTVIAFYDCEVCEPVPLLLLPIFLASLKRHRPVCSRQS